MSKLREYPVKKTIKLSKEYIVETSRQFSDDVREENGSVILSIPGISKIEIRINGKKIEVDTSGYEKNTDGLNTVSIYNNLIEKLTGYSAKERKKLISK